MEGGPSLGGGVRIGAAIEEEAGKLEVRVVQRQHERAHAVGHPLVDVGARFEQGARGVDVAAAHGKEKGRELAGRRGVNVGAGGRQHPDGRCAIFGGRPHQRRLSLAGFLGIDVRAAADERLHGVHVARPCRRHQHRLAFGQGRVGIGSGGEQLFDHRGVAVGRREMKRCDAVAVRDLRLRAGLEQRPGHLEIVELGGPMERGRAVGFSGVDVGVFREQGAGNRGVPALDRLDERGRVCQNGAPYGDDTQSEQKRHRHPSATPRALHHRHLEPSPAS